MNIVIFGAPGSGKGTQSEKIIANHGLHHISTGEVLRDHIARQTEIGKVAQEYISKGQLIPDELMINILDDIIANEPKARKGLILDGFPRTIPQAQALEGLLAKHDMKLDHVVGLEVPDDELVDRMIKRGQLTGRADDTPETIKNRLQVYHNQTAPLQQYYKDAGKYRAINGLGTVDDIATDIAAALNA